MPAPHSHTLPTPANSVKAGEALALVCQAPGWPPRLEVGPRDPAAPSPGEVRVRVVAASVNPIDVKRAQGYGRRVLGIMGAARFPLSLGNDLAGVILAVGEGETRLKPGQRVIGVQGPSRLGTHASETVAKAAHMIEVPDGLPLEPLAALPYCFVTMWIALRQAGLQPSTALNAPVLIHGASGGIGLLATQLLTRWGARVTGIASADSLPAVVAAGAEQAHDWRSRPWDLLSGRFDATLNFANWLDEPTLLRCLRPGALGHATTVHPLLSNVDGHGYVLGALRSAREFRAMRARLPMGTLRYGWTLFKPDVQALQALAMGLDQAAPMRLRLPIGLSVPVDQAQRAFEHVAKGRPGRALILFGATA